MRTAACFAAVVLVSLCSGVHATAAAESYAIVVSKATQSDAAWKPVVEALQAKHAGATVIVYDAAVTDALPELRKQFPRYVCFVAKPAEASSKFVAEVHRLTRKLDDDPYTDCLWGILTGYDAANALRIARQSEPLTVKRVASGTEVALDQCVEGQWYCELNQFKHITKKAGGKPEPDRGPADTTQALVQSLNDYHPDLFVTSGHATEHDWQIGYRYRNGQFRSAAGKLTGFDTHGGKFPVDSANPKVYLPIGNCLMGHIDGPDSMALAWMNSAGVDQMIGYTVPTWYGYAGWGLLDYFVEQPGRYTLAEAFFVNEQALIHRLDAISPEARNLAPDPGEMMQCRVTPVEGLTAQDATGLLHDRDVLAFYGDPAWIARMADGPRAYEQTLTEKDDVYTLDIKPNLGASSFAPVNTNGAQRGYRPFVALLPHRIGAAKVTEGEDLKPLITDDFILVPNPRKCDPSRAYRIVFHADPLK